MSRPDRVDWLLVGTSEIARKRVAAALAALDTGRLVGVCGSDKKRVDDLADAHGAGVLGERLRGTAEQCGLGGRRVIQSITFSKALGSFGGAILGPRWLRAALLDGNNVVTGSSSLPAGLAKATLASLELLRTRPALAKRLRRNTAFVKAKSVSYTHLRAHET